jgi:3-deoxy-D-manno-octulosonic-acid transferase
LTKAYYFGKIAIVGGGFTGKLHNILEPVVFGIPVLFGPKNQRFPEAKLFREKKIAFEFKNQNELEEIIEKLEKKDESMNIEEIFESMAGASQQIVEGMKF